LIELTTYGNGLLAQPVNFRIYSAGVQVGSDILATAISTVRFQAAIPAALAANILDGYWIEAVDAAGTRVPVGCLYWDGTKEVTQQNVVAEIDENQEILENNPVGNFI